MSARPDFQGVNAGYVLELYDRFKGDPASVDPDTRKFFESWTPPESFAFGEAELKPLRSGEALAWKLVGNGSP